MSQPIAAGTHTVVVAPTKSVGVALLLTFFFGPLGMLYSTVTGAVVMFLVTAVLAFFTLGLSLFLTWPVCMIWGAMAVNTHNQRLMTGAAPY